MEIKIEDTGGMVAGETRVFSFLRNGREAEGFIIRVASGFRAYLNQCCHWPSPLDMGDGDFYYAAIGRITCKTHGATYEPETGLCDSGPCVRARLTAYPVEVAADGNGVRVTVPDSPEKPILVPATPGT